MPFSFSLILGECPQFSGWITFLPHLHIVWHWGKDWPYRSRIWISRRAIRSCVREANTLRGVARGERDVYLFKVAEHVDGPPFIYMVPRGRGVQALDSGVLGFDLRVGTTLKEAKQFARLLNEDIECVFYSAFSDEPQA
jgi:hypothetical protein